MAPRSRVLHDHSSLSTRVYAVEEDVRDLKRALEAGFAALHTKFDERARIPWPGLAMVLSITIAVGGLAYWPIRERQSEMLIEDKNRYQELVERDRRLWDQVIQARLDIEQLKVKVNQYGPRGN